MITNELTNLKKLLLHSKDEYSVTFGIQTRNDQIPLQACVQYRYMNNEYNNGISSSFEKLTQID